MRVLFGSRPCNNPLKNQHNGAEVGSELTNSV